MAGQGCGAAEPAADAAGSFGGDTEPTKEREPFQAFEDVGRTGCSPGLTQPTEVGLLAWMPTEGKLANNLA
jgi:hypothetical protein